MIMVSGTVPSLNETVALVHDLTATNTKDSLMVRWNIEEDYAVNIQSFVVSYQALGSTVVQYSHHLPAQRIHHEIMQLHENTYYDICIQVYTNLSHVNSQQACIKATTSTDSLSVALGSTFGAFLALGVIVFFVFIAKWNHNRKLQKQLQQVQPESYESVDQQDMELSEVSLAVNEDTAPLDVSSSHSSSQFSTRAATANGSSGPHRQSRRDKARKSLRRGESVDHEAHRYKDQDIPEEPVVTAQAAADTAEAEQNPFINPDGRPPDVRPKNSAVVGAAVPSYGTSSLLATEPMHAGLRPNLSCPNWLAQI